MKYKDPNKVISPKDTIKKVKVIYDGGDSSVSIAKIKWGKDEVIGIRWNVGMREWNNPDKKSGTKTCVGVPSSRGYPTWFILPKKLLNKNSEMWKKLNEVIESEWFNKKENQ